MQWHFEQENPNSVVTARKFFPNEPVKLRSVQNQAKKGLSYQTEKLKDGVTGSRVTERKGGLLPLLDEKMDIIWKELEAKEAPRSDSVLLPLMEEHGYHIYRNHVKYDTDGLRYIAKEQK